MTASPTLRIGVVGPGRLGSSLAAAVIGAASTETPSPRTTRELPPRFQVVGVAGRDRRRTASAAARLGVPALTLAELTRTADLVLLTVGDDALADLATEIAATSEAAATGTDRPAPCDGPPSRKAPAAVHCSGACSPDILLPLARLGWATAAWHPLQAFPTATTAPAAGTTWTVTTDDPALAALLDELTRDLGGTLRPLPAGHRPAYHAAAVMAANYPATLIAHAVALLVDAGFTPEQALRALLPLARSALDALAVAGLPDGLTGPVMRGDLGTVTAHLDALADRPDTRELYIAAARSLLDLARTADLDPALADALAAALHTGPHVP